MKFLTRIICLMCITFLSGYTASGVTANFTADVVSGCAPLVVHFTNTSAGATSYFWDLGNTTTYTGINPSTSYLTPGTYTVTLTASNGSSSNVHTLTITVFPVPTVSFNASVTTVCPGSPVTFSSTSSGGVPGPMTYAWNFGDGYASTSATPSHSYATPGNYNVTLSVTNSQGCVSSLTRTAFIHVLTPAAVNFSAAPSYFCSFPATAVFVNGTTGTAPLSYQWSFGDGGTSTAASPSHIYTLPGSYTVKLVVTDGNGCIETLVRSSYITLSNLSANFTSVTTACTNTSVTFTNTSSVHTSSTWFFGDGGTSTADNTTHTFTTPGTYNVRLIVYDGFCFDTVIHTVTITPGPPTSFIMNPSNPCPAPSAVTFTGSAPTGSVVRWLYGDGGTGTGPTTTHTFIKDTINTIMMITTGPTGCIDTLIRADTIYDMTVSIMDTPTSGCAPLTVNFSLSVTSQNPFGNIPYPYPVGSYIWRFGDGSPNATTPATSHTYTAPGVYTVIVTAVTANGCPISDTDKIYVGIPPTVAFTASPRHICADQGSTFVATHTGTVTNYIWNFGDGTLQSDSFGTVIHDYSMPGTYSATVTAYYNGCPSVPFVQTNYILVDSPKAIFSIGYSCVPPTRVTFTNSSIGVDTYLWIFGDGDTTSMVWEPVHNYPAIANYTVQLVTYNRTSGCHDTATRYVVLIRPIPDFTADDTAVCRDEYITFTPNIIGGTADYYAWFVDNVMIEDTVAIFVDTFHVRGYHTIKLVIRDGHGCYDTLSKTNYVIIGKPIASFSVLPASGCVPLTVAFTDHATDVPGTWLTNFSWTFGDSTTSSVGIPTTSHTYTAIGTYSVQEIVTDNIGCKDTINRPSLIHVTKAHAQFYGSSNHPCAGDLVAFTNISTGVAHSYWYFGDGDTSTTFSPTHTYSTSGTYTVKLVIIDTNGCADSATYVNYITITKPHASFTMSDSFSVCAPLLVNFTNTSTGAISYNWFFGDGNTSVITSPSDLYISVGYDTVMLVATNTYGCKDTARRHVNIFGYAGAFSYAPLIGCTPLTVSFTATVTNVSSIIWDFADGTTSPPSVIPTTTHVYAIPGAYIPRLVLSDNTGCENSAPGIDTIKVDAVKTGFSTSPVCVGGTVTFTDTSTSYWSTVNSWYWTFDGQTSTIDSPSHTFNTAGTYTVTLRATDGWDCSATMIRDLIVYPLPAIDAGADTTVCVGDPATLNGTGGVSYVWAAPATLSCTACNPALATPTVPTTYTVTGTDEHGCVNTDTIRVLLKTKTESVVGPGGEICSGASLQLTDSGATKYIWLPGSWLSDSYAANPIATPASTITYTVIAQIGSCIPDTNYVTIIVHPTPTVDAGPDQSLLAGTEAQLHAVGTNIYTYSWTPAFSLSCDTCADPVATMSVTTTYIVHVSTDYGCLASDSVTISLHCSDNQIFIPNTFTPNGDGENDVFYPRGGGVSIIKSFRIYNRWGQLLFEKTNIQINDKSNAWDGSYGGASARPDVYVYVVEGTCETGQPLFIKGDVTIVR